MTATARQDSKITPGADQSCKFDETKIDDTILQLMPRLSHEVSEYNQATGHTERRVLASLDVEKLHEVCWGGNQDEGGVRYLLLGPQEIEVVKGFQNAAESGISCDHQLRITLLPNDSGPESALFTYHEGFSDKPSYQGPLLRGNEGSPPSCLYPFSMLYFKPLDELESLLKPEK